jgi:prevent-host-death family protein
MRAAKTVPLLRIMPVLTARTQLGQILKRVRQNNERFVVDKRGEPQAVISSALSLPVNSSLFWRPIRIDSRMIFRR